MKVWPRSLFSRTALLIAGTLLAFSIIAWQVMVWTVVVPTAEVTVTLLAQRARTALAVQGVGGTLPPDTRFEAAAPSALSRPARGFAFGAYVEAVRNGVQAALGVDDVRINRMAAPSEIWVSVGAARGGWLVLDWRFAGPKAPLAALGVLGAAALLVLGGAAFSARRLTAPLAGLAVAAGRVAQGERVNITAMTGPGEVRALAAAFQSMSLRLAEVDEQRELMLGGISHDLRTPLARIRVAIELLEGADPLLTREMTASVEEMDRMIGQFLHYVRANHREQPALASLDELVRDTLAVHGEDGPLRLELHGGPARRFAVECMRHSLLNLVQNAFEYGRSPVVVRTAATADGVTLSVEDEGPGLSPEEWAAAVRPFHRLDGQLSQGHCGLGLALVDRLVRTSGGRLQGGRHAGGFQVQVWLPVQRDG